MHRYINTYIHTYTYTYTHAHSSHVQAVDGGSGVNVTCFV